MYTLFNSATYKQTNALSFRCLYLIARPKSRHGGRMLIKRITFVRSRRCFEGVFAKTLYYDGGISRKSVPQAPQIASKRAKYPPLSGKSDPPARDGFFHERGGYFALFEIGR